MAKNKDKKIKKSVKQAVRQKQSYTDVMGFHNVLHNEKINFILGIFVMLFGIYMAISFASYFLTADADQSLVLDLRPGTVIERSFEFQNLCGSIGALLSYFFISRCFGIAAFLIPIYIFVSGLQLAGAYRINLLKWFFCTVLIMIWLSVTSAQFLSPLFEGIVFTPGGDHGEYCRQYLMGIIGTPGLLCTLGIVALGFLTYLTSETIDIARKIMNPLEAWKKRVVFTVNDPVTEGGVSADYRDPAAQTADFNDGMAIFSEPKNTDDKDGVTIIDETTGEVVLPGQPGQPDQSGISGTSSLPGQSDTDLEVVVTQAEAAASGKSVSPTPDLSTPINPREPFLNYKFPTLDLLKTYDSDGKPYIDKDELMANKNRIIQVLHSFGVEISAIKATVGPTITLYEITPAEGVRISKIRNLEDDIALSLAALGIRIIAPIPGKGTIGIEVPNAKASIVSMESILNSRKFQETTMELPIALGKTITNEVFMVDLAKIPHLLVAGATGQGKSVGLNAIITSLLYKKHPNELKIVLVDPKKVEFSIYEPIADHFMAKVDDDDADPIITDVTKVVHTLKSLCALMDHRYDMLKMAGARNIKEYNKKYLSHQLRLTDGHEFMPYVVVIIDEFGDLIMTAGREVELPIARIAQLARAVGIHMVIATQRPTTTIITGNIKANFPGRMAFRVGAMIDSRTILDKPGANQLVGRGDMLFLNGNEPVRVQCAFVDTPEVEQIAKFIAAQPGPVEPLILPEPVSDGDGLTGGIGDSGLADLDPLFDEACRFIVASNQGSTSSIQRKFSIGYNRAGRLMDQIERAGIVGAAQGSKPREVLITDTNSLESILAQLRQ